MSYFYGLGAGKGWSQTFFFVAPEQLRDLLSSHSIKLFIHNARAPRNYSETSLDEYVESYSRFYEIIQLGQSTSWEILGPLYVGLTDKRISLIEKAIDAEYKKVECTEPCLSFAPLQACYTSDRLCINASHQDSDYVGLVMSYPKIVFSSEQDYAVAEKTNGFHNYRLHQSLEQRIKTETVPLSMVKSGNSIKTRIRTTPSASDILAHHIFLVRHGYSIKAGRPKQGSQWT